MGSKHISRKRNRGFSLVELVIVLVILGVIAAIAIPRVSRGSRGAGESALSSNLAVLRNAVELYASEHNGVYPGTKPDGTFDTTETTFIEQLTKYSDSVGNTNDTKTAQYPYGPYLRKGIPPVPVGPNATGSTPSKVKIDTTGPAVAEGGGEGWVYNPKTGDIIANTDDNNEAGDKTFDQY